MFVGQDEGRITQLENQITPDFSAVAPKLPADAVPKAMLTVHRDGTQTTVRINSSSLSVIQTCPRKAMYSLHQGWRAKQSSPPLVFGQAIHRAMEVFYGSQRYARTMPANFGEHAKLMAHGHEAPEQHFMYDAVKAFVTAAEPLRGLPDGDKRSIVSGIWTLGHYFKTYLNDIYVIHRDEQGPLIERTCEAVLTEDTSLRIVVFGTIDMILRNEATGETLPGDHKTSSQMGPDFLNRIKPNHQYTGYLWLAQKCLGITSENFLVNGIQVKQAYGVGGKSLGAPTFTRQITRRTAEDFAEFTDALDFAVRSYLSWLNAEVWPLGNVDSCANWGGCQYLDVCSAPNALRKNILEAKYEIK